MRVIPGSHQEALPQRDTFHPDNALSRGQEIAVEVNEDGAVTMELAPGQMSLHHVGLAHASHPNNSDEPRIGLAVRYIAAEVKQHGVEPQPALLVRGEDRHGNFEIVQPPIAPPGSGR